MLQTILSLKKIEIYNVGIQETVPSSDVEDASTPGFDDTSVELEKLPAMARSEDSAKACSFFILRNYLRLMIHRKTRPCLPVKSKKLSPRWTARQQEQELDPPHLQEKRLTR